MADSCQRGPINTIAGLEDDRQFLVEMGAVAIQFEDDAYQTSIVR
jgi:hypothetical protein